MNVKLDEFDIKILNVVQSNNRTPVEQIAEEVSLSPSAIQRRLRRLRDSGVIEEDVSVISPEAVGRRLTAIIEVVLERENPQVIESFKRVMESTPEVMQCYYVTGEADFILILTTEDMQTYADLVRRLLTGNPNVRRITTSLVLERVKVGFRVPLKTE